MEAAALELFTRIGAEMYYWLLVNKECSFLNKMAPWHVETKTRHVADVSGAGDTVIATLTMAMVAGASVIESAALANYAAE